MPASITTADILDLVEYERARDEIRHSAMVARRLRRVPVGPIVSVCFESTETVRYQIQEMVRVERIVDDEGVQAEIDAYADLLPGSDSLAATLFIEIDDPLGLREWLPRLVGIEHSVSLEVGGAGTSRAVGEQGRSKEDLTSTVHYLRFPFTPAQVDALGAGAACVLRVDHESYAHSGGIPRECALALAGDLAAAGQERQGAT